MKKTFTLLTLLFCWLITHGQKGLVEYEIRAGHYGSMPSSFTHAFGNAYFTAFDNVTDKEIWYCQGANPPQMLTNIYTLGTILGAVNGALYYTAATTFTYELDIYKYDGVNPPAYLLTLAPGDSATNINYGCVLDGKLYFNARTKSQGYAIWRLDPVTDQVQMVYDPPGYDYLEHMTVYNNKLYYTAQGLSADYELHEYDPATGIENMFDINPGPPPSDAKCLGVIDGRLYLMAKEPNYGNELYVFEGQGQPQRITDIMPGNADGVYLPSPVGLNGNIYFIGRSSATKVTKIYKYEPLNSNVSMVYDVYPQHNNTISTLGVYGNNLYLAASDGQGAGVELMMYDLVQPPFIIADAKNPGSSNPTLFRVYNNSLYFNGEDQGSGTELYKYTDSALSVEKIAFDGNITLHPNPAISDVTITIEHNKTENLVITLSDLAGRIVYTHHLPFTNGVMHTVLSLGELSYGTYLCRVQNNNGELYHKTTLVKQ